MYKMKMHVFEIRQTSPIVIILFLLAPLCLCEDTVSDTSGQLPPNVCYCLQKVTSGLMGPVGSVFFMDNIGEERVIVVEQIGVATIFSMSGHHQGTFMDIRDRVVRSDAMGESRGLLSMVLDPDYKQNKKVFVYYIRKVDNEDYAYISSFTAPNDKVDPNSERTLLRIYQPFLHGNGGPMLFGDDGYLYIVTGDGGEEDDVTGRAQDMDTFYGKVLRIDPDGPQSFTRGESSVGKLYSVPDTNPYIGDSDAMEEVYASGIRNSWGCSQDIAGLGGSGRLFCAETGTNMADEINIIESGKNYGWNIKEGSRCNTNETLCGNIDNEGIPIHEFNHTAQHSLVGGHVYRGHVFPNFNASAVYVFGDVITGKIYVLEEKASGLWSSLEWPHCGEDACPGHAQDKPLPHIFGFGRDSRGELYPLMSGGFVVTDDDGVMFKLVPPNSAGLSLPFVQLLLVVQVMLLVLWSL